MAARLALVGLLASLCAVTYRSVTWQRTGTMGQLKSVLVENGKGSDHFRVSADIQMSRPTLNLHGLHLESGSCRVFSECSKDKSEQCEVFNLELGKTKEDSSGLLKVEGALKTSSARSEDAMYSGDGWLRSLAKHDLTFVCEAKKSVDIFGMGLYRQLVTERFKQVLSGDGNSVRDMWMERVGPPALTTKNGAFETSMKSKFHMSFAPSETSKRFASLFNGVKFTIDTNIVYSVGDDKHVEISASFNGPVTTKGDGTTDDVVLTVPAELSSGVRVNEFVQALRQSHSLVVRAQEPESPLALLFGRQHELGMKKSDGNNLFFRRLSANENSSAVVLPSNCSDDAQTYPIHLNNLNFNVSFAMCGEGDDQHVDVALTDDVSTLVHVAGSMNGSSLAFSAEVGPYFLGANLTSESQTMSGSFKAGSGDNFLHGQAMIKKSGGGADVVQLISAGGVVLGMAPMAATTLRISQIDASLVDASGTTLFTTTGLFDHDENKTFHLSVLDNSFDVRSDASSQSVSFKIGDLEASGAIKELEHGGFKVELKRKAGEMMEAANISVSAGQKSFDGEFVWEGEKLVAVSAHQNDDGFGLSASVMETHINATMTKNSEHFAFLGAVSSNGEDMARIDASCTNGNACSLQAGAFDVTVNASATIGNTTTVDFNAKQAGSEIAKIAVSAGADHVGLEVSSQGASLATVSATKTGQSSGSVSFNVAGTPGFSVDVNDGDVALREGTDTAAPTSSPTGAPTSAPTAAPTDAPTAAPTLAPTAAPTAAPTEPTRLDPTPAPTDFLPASNAYAFQTLWALVCIVTVVGTA
jgi:hypothetical protein